MSAAESIFSALSDPASATAALVGSDAACRVFPEQAPPAIERPYVVFSQVGAQPATTHNEPFETATRLFQFACFATTFSAAVALRDAIIADLDNATLTNGDSPIFQDERSGYEDAVDLHRADADFLV
jgi:hypothetical protein